MAKQTDTGGGIVESIKTIVYALLIAAVFRTLFFQPFWIPSGSMKETLLVGDFLFVNKMAYGYSQYSCPFALCPIEGRLFGSDPEYGDVVVFRHPVTGADYIKRLIALPGDEVQMRNGEVILNGEALPREDAGTHSEPYAAQGSMGGYPRCANAPVGEGGTCEKTRLRETLPNGVSYNILQISEGSPGDNTDAFTVPEAHYFFVGDNRDNSQDSRFPQAVGGVGFVSEDKLIGRARHVVFSSAGTSMLYFWTWRSDRFFERLE